ncbi:type I polyketide synthase, partial [Streptomyces avermitilis]|uniref:type I polyketide synthase n=1 Tax=Streptomyces avermitilis TaxID=33903 RepID=UPI0033B8AB6F
TAALTLADNNTQLLTGRLSLRTHPWLTDHTVVGTTLVPGTALLELALQATATDHLEELALHTPLVIPREGAVDVQVHINPPDDTDTRSLTIYSRSENAPAEAPWRHHATAVLGAKTSRIETGRSHDDLSMWPPAGAVRCADEELAALYGDYEANGFVYGPAFRGLTAAWRLGDEVFAEVRLPEHVHSEASAYNLHPALLDAALHAAAFAPSGSLPQGSVPFSFTGVTLHAANASSLRVRLSPADPNSGQAAVSVLIADDTGTPVASVEALAVRPLAVDELRAAERAVQRAELFDMHWVEVPSDGLVSGGASVAVLDDADDLVGLAAEGGGVPGVVVLRCPDASGGGGAVGEVVGGVLGVVQGWLALERFAGSRLVVVTRGAVVTGPEEGPGDGVAGPGDGLVDVVGAAVWGLVRSAQAEHPDRFVLLDLDTGTSADLGTGAGSGVAGGRVAAVVACGEPQLAVRGERVLAARLTRLQPSVGVPDREVLPWLSGGSVLVTGGTGVLGAAVARHLAGECGVRDLLLVSRRGPDAPGAQGLRAELAALGAQVRIVACDVGERSQLERLLEDIPAACPLTGVVHTAGVLDDATIASLTPGRLGTVFAAKVEAALLLDELTRGMELS